MRLETTSVEPGDWVIISNAAPDEKDLSLQFIRFGDKKYPAYVDGRNLMIRCPPIKNATKAKVFIHGKEIGVVQISP